MANKKKSRHLFLKGMIIYVVLFAVIAAGALFLLYKYMEAYELSGNKAYMREYMQDLSEGMVPAACERELEKLDLSIKSEDDTRQWISELLAEAAYVRIPGENGSGRESYSIISRGAEIGRVTIEPSGIEKFGLEMWQISDVSYDLSSFASDYSCYLPEGYSLQVGDANIAPGKETREYKALDYVYERYDEIPEMRYFASGKYLGDAEVVVKNAAGKVLSADQLTEQTFLNNCDEALNAELRAFGEDFINRYVDYGAMKDGEFFYHYSRLKEAMVYKGELYDRVTSGWEGIFYSSTEYCNILDLNVNICCELTENLYMVDVSYTTETKGLADAVVSDNYARIVVARDEDSGELLAANMYNY